MLFLSIAGGEILDPHFEVMGLDHRQLSLHIFRTHERMIREMQAEHTREEMRYVSRLSPTQQQKLVDFMHPEKGAPIGPSQRVLRGGLRRALTAGARLMRTPKRAVPALRTAS